MRDEELKDDEQTAGQSHGSLQDPQENLSNRAQLGNDPNLQMQPAHAPDPMDLQ